MPYRLLVDGVTVEADTAEEMLVLIEHQGRRIEKIPVVRGWVRERARSFFETCPPHVKATLEALRSAGLQATTARVAEALDRPAPVVGRRIYEVARAARAFDAELPAPARVVGGRRRREVKLDPAFLSW
jgi:hypothetical protein